MPSLFIYDTKGNEQSQSGTTGRTNDRVKDLFYEGVRFAIETGRETEYTVFFRARETPNARTEQFYAVQKTRNGSIQEFMTALRERIESDWGYTIDDTADDMSVFRALDQGVTPRPGSDQDHAILRELVGSSEGARVNVRDAENALGTIREMREAYNRAAIADSPGSNALSGFDLVIVPDGSTGIVPIGDTEGRWESTKESLRNRNIDQEIASINDSVQTLSREYGLSNSEIRKRINRRIPALAPPRSGVSDPSRADELINSGSSDQFDAAVIGKIAAIAAVVAIVLIIAVVGPPTFGIPGILDLGGDEVSGTVYVDAAGEEPGSNVTVTLEPTGASDENTEPNTETTNEAGEFSFEGVSEGNYTLSVESTEGVHYDEIPIKIPENTTNHSILPTEATVSGEVVDAETGEPLSADGNAGVDATIELVDESGEPIQNTTGGSYEFTVTELDARYNLSADANGYDPVERPVESFGTQEPIELEPAGVSLSGRVTDMNGTSIEGATVEVIVSAGKIPSATTDSRGEYEITGLPPGENYRVEVIAQGYETKSVSLDLGEDGLERSFELQPS